MIQLWLDSLDVAHSSRKQYGSTLTRLQAWLSDRGQRLGDLKTGMVLAWLESLIPIDASQTMIMPATNNRHRAAIRGFCEHHEITIKLPPLKINKKREQYIPTRDEVVRIFSAPIEIAEQSGHGDIVERNTLILSLSALMGLRKEEIIELTIADAYTTASGDRVLSAGQAEEVAAKLRLIGKGSKRRFLAIPEDVSDLIWEYLGTRSAVSSNNWLFPSPEKGNEDNHLKPSTIDSMWSRVKQHVGLPENTRGIHALRHYFATQMIDSELADVPPEKRDEALKAAVKKLKRMLGHVLDATTEGYIHALMDWTSEADKIAMSKAAEGML